MMVDDSKQVAQAAKDVIEKRTGTVIRRRAKKVEPAPEPIVSAESADQTDAQPIVEAAPPPPPPPAPKPEVRVIEAQPFISQPEADKIAAEQQKAAAESGVVFKPAEGPEMKPIEGAVGVRQDGVRRIGVVGRIDLGTTSTPTPSGTTTVVMAGAGKEKEDWRERLKRGPKRKKSNAELEMEAIQRAGGLLQYAVTTDDEPGAAAAVVEAPAQDRIFQPIPARRNKKLSSRREFKKTEVTEKKAIKKVIRLEEGISVGAMSQALGVKVSDIMKRLVTLGVMVTVNDIVDADTATLVAEEHGYKVEKTGFNEESVLAEPEAMASAENLAHRAPVVTVMGHVDHGKTSILDAIRKAKVAAGEAGGITQHIGAYEVKLPNGKITFLDTPGHAAFTMMRARGAQATDIVILVVAADDGIMPQTIEAIDHAKAAGVPIIVAINKIDRPNANPDRVKQSMTEHGLVTEEWGGDVICVPTSAVTGEGIKQLLDMVLIQAEMLELRSDPTIRPKGIVIETRLDKGRGPVATVLVQEGTLKVGSYVVCGMYDGKVRAMFDYEGNQIKEAGPSKPVEILGLGGTPSAGDEMVGVADDRAARMVCEQRLQKKRQSELGGAVRVSLEDLATQVADGEVKELNVVVKADVHGSVEAVRDSLAKLSTDKVKLRVLHSAVGGIIESDIMLARASNAIVLGFNVQPDGKAKSAAQAEKVEIRTYRIIYEMLDEVRNAMEGLLSPIESELYLGRAEVRNTFRITKVGMIAGCMVVNGKIVRSARVRLLRDQVVVVDGKISSLKRFKDDAKEVQEGYECGISIENYNDIKVGDVIEAYTIEKKAAQL